MGVVFTLFSCKVQQKVHRPVYSTMPPALSELASIHHNDGRFKGENGNSSCSQCRSAAVSAHSQQPTLGKLASCVCILWDVPLQESAHHQTCIFHLYIPQALCSCVCLLWNTACTQGDRNCVHNLAASCVCGSCLTECMHQALGVS